MDFLFFISASFYGGGHASLPFQDAQSTTDLSFRFRTSRAEALLVLVAGRTDYCLVMLQAGAVKVISASVENWTFSRLFSSNPSLIFLSKVIIERPKNVENPKSGWNYPLAVSNITHFTLVHIAQKVKQDRIHLLHVSRQSTLP